MHVVSLSEMFQYLGNWNKFIFGRRVPIFISIFLALLHVSVEEELMKFVFMLEMKIGQSISQSILCIFNPETFPYMIGPSLF